MFEIEDATPPVPGSTNTAPAKAAERPGIPLEPRRIVWEVMRRQRWIWVGVIFSAAWACSFALKYAPREFAVTSLLTWDGTIVHTPGADPLRQMRTLLNSVKTPAVLLEVRSKLGLSTTLEGLSGQIDVGTDDRSNMIMVTTAAGSPDEALKLGQTLLEVFQRQRLVSEKTQREDTANGLADRLAVATKDLAALRNQQLEFLKQEQVTDLTAELAQASADSVRYVQEQVAAGADVAAEQARVDSLTAAMQHRKSTVVFSEKVVRPEGAKLADVESELAGLRGGGLSEDHPRIKMLEAQAQGMRERKADSWDSGVVTERSSGRNPEIANFQNRIIDAEAAREAAAGREKALAALAAEASTKLDRLRSIDRRGADLTRALAVALAHVADLTDQHALALEASRAPVTGLSLLEAPALPSGPRKSLRKAYAIGASIGGAIVGFLLVLLWSFRGLRVHTSTELAFWGNGPVVTSSQWPRRPFLNDLRDELSSQLVGAPPGVLLLPAGSRELGLLRELAEACGWPAHMENSEREPPVRAWLGEASGHAVRKAVRGASRLVVLACAGEHSALALSELGMRIGARAPLGFVLLDVTDELVVLPESVGDVDGFWHPTGEAPRLRVVSG